MGIKLSDIQSPALRSRIESQLALGETQVPCGTSQGGEPVDKEIPLHHHIIEWCNSQWPKWKYRHCNPVKKSTDTKGCEDFTIFGTGGVTFHIECKAKGGKLSAEQVAWRKEMEMIGHTVHVVTNFGDFLQIVNPGQPSS